MAAKRQNVHVLKEEVQLTLDFLMTAPAPSELPSRRVVPFPTPKPSPALKSVPNKRQRGRPEGRAEPAGNDFEWSKDTILQMRVRLLKATLAELANPLVGGRKEKLAWLASDGIGPFSYRVCCSAAGYDPDEFRNAMRDYVEDATWRHFDDD
ncbi:hypothetical protein [Halomonas sp. KO116]|uniref:hypothetical protein n=1 Tax=Halomonas sp. KO116 TaxID=1504981 RepID=UPI0004E2BB54|nr:hypothetical protein [Halomonas sp. KO116]AJY53140.1 hypothetical protein KO116_P200033 [Halomonas sp. KO116]